MSFEAVDLCAISVLRAFGLEGLQRLMHEIPVSNARNWQAPGEHYIPKSVKTTCPHCNQPSSLTLTLQYEGRQLGSVNLGFEAECTQCPERVQVWIIGANHKSTKQQSCQSIWMLPIPVGQKQPKDFGGDIPKRIRKAYETAIQCFNSHIWTAAINECGRVIEGITEDKFQSNELRQQLKEASDKQLKADTADSILFSPILQLSSAIRLSRRSASHFRFTDDPDSDTAQKVITLTEYALEYFYGLPQKAREIKQLIDELEEKLTEPETDTDPE